MKFKPQTFALITKEGKIIQKNIEDKERAQSLKSALLPNCACNIMRANSNGKLQFVGGF